MHGDIQPFCNFQVALAAVIIATLNLHELTVRMYTGSQSLCDAQTNDAQTTGGVLAQHKKSVYLVKLGRLIEKSLKGPDVEYLN
jgi:hypothetical protein